MKSSEFSVDSNLENFLNTSEKPPDKPAVILQDDDLVPEEEPPIPVSTESKHDIYNMLNIQGMFPSNPNETARLFKYIRGMSEQEATAYLDALQANRSSYFSREASTRLISMLNEILIPLGDDDTKKSIIKDQLLIDEFALNTGVFFSKLGKLKPLFLYGIYFVSSTLKTYNGFPFKSITQAYTRQYNASTTVQNDGSSQVSNG